MITNLEGHDFVVREMEDHVYLHALGKAFVEGKRDNAIVGYPVLTFSDAIAKAIGEHLLAIAKRLGEKEHPE